MRLLACFTALPLFLVATPALAKSQNKSKPTKSAHHAAPTRGRKSESKPKAHVERERPVSTYTKGGNPNIQAEAAVVIDLKSGEELFAKHPDDVRPIASISKLMAMLVVLERKLDLEGVTTMAVSDRDLARRGAPSRLPTGMKFTNRDLLHAALMASDNRAVPALGRAVGLDAEQMTVAMNEKARKLGLTHTSFGDPTGLDDRNRSTPRELARILAAAASVPLIAEITRKARYIAHSVDKPGYSVSYENTDMVARAGRFEVLTGKTGYTDLAGYCLAIAAHLPPESGNRDVAMVFLGEAGKLTRFGDFGRVAQWVAERKASPVTAPAPDSTAVAEDRALPQLPTAAIPTGTSH